MKRIIAAKLTLIILYVFILLLMADAQRTTTITEFRTVTSTVILHSNVSYYASF